MLDLPCVYGGSSRHPHFESHSRKEAEQGVETRLQMPEPQGSLCCFPGLLLLDLDQQATNGLAETTVEIGTGIIEAN